MTQAARRSASSARRHHWEPIFFRAIDERARLGEPGDLRSVGLTGSDLEVRVWIGFGLVPLEGVIIKRTSENWSALHVRPVSSHLPRHEYQRILPPPKSGWEELWARLTDEGILTLPDDSQFEDKVRASDGESYVVEVNMGGSYRTYRYSNPHLQKWPEATRMINIAGIILNEFDIDRSVRTRQ